jgi:recombination protein RecA
VVTDNEAKRKRLSEVTQQIQNRWGHQAIHTFTAAETIPHVPTSYEPLDSVLGIGGVPRGRITEILGAPTSGAATLILRIIASAQRQQDMAIYIDPLCTFDPVYAAQHGVNPDQVLLIRNPHKEKAWEMARDLISSGGVGVMTFHTSHLGQPPNGMLSQINTALGKSPCALLILQSLQRPVVNVVDFASLRLQLTRERWLRRRAEVSGYRTRVTILKNKLAPVGRSVGITIPLQRGVHP